VLFSASGSVSVAFGFLLESRIARMFCSTWGYLPSRVSLES
jgi:hypothetical protein